MLFPEKLGVKRLEDGALLPHKAHYGDLGYDLFSLEAVTLHAGTVTKVRTGIACNFPSGYGALVRDRSSMATKHSVFVVAGVIDEGYTGEILVAMYNPDNYDKYFSKGDKIAQMILTPVITFPVEEVHDLANTARGTGGFGSTGS